MLVGDGLATNIAMFSKLGVDMMPDFDLVKKVKKGIKKGIKKA